MAESGNNNVDKPPRHAATPEELKVLRTLDSTTVRLPLEYFSTVMPDFLDLKFRKLPTSPLNKWGWYYNRNFVGPARDMVSNPFFSLLTIK